MADISSIADRVKKNPADASAWLELAGALSALGREQEAEYSRKRAQSLLRMQSAHPIRPDPLPAASQTVSPAVQNPWPSPGGQPVRPSVQMLENPRPTLGSAGPSLQSATVLLSTLLSVMHTAMPSAQAVSGWFLTQIAAPFLHGLAAIGKFLVIFFFRGSGTLNPILRFYYVCNLVAIPVFGYMMAHSDGVNMESMPVRVLVWWVIIAILLEKNARGLAWKAGSTFFKFMVNAAGISLSAEGCIGTAVALIVGYLIIVFALSLAVVLGALYLWFISLYELGKDTLAVYRVS